MPIILYVLAASVAFIISPSIYISAVSHWFAMTACGSLYADCNSVFSVLSRMTSVLSTCKSEEESDYIYQQFNILFITAALYTVPVCWKHAALLYIYIGSCQVIAVETMYNGWKESTVVQSTTTVYMYAHWIENIHHSFITGGLY
jgi:uncharacterized membrane protein